MNSASSYDESAKVWRGPRMQRIFAEDCSAGLTAFYMMKSKPPEAVCQISDSEGVELTYGTAIKYAVRVAQHLERLGVTQDDVVGFLAPNTSLMLPVAVACLMHGTAFHAINIAHEDHVVKHIFGISKPKVIFCDGLLYEKAKTAVSEFDVRFFTFCNHVEGVSRVEDLLEPTETELFYTPKPLKYGTSQVAAICNSSGTTGLPKGVPVSHATLTKDVILNDGSDVVFSFSSPDWLMGLLSIIFIAVNGGRRIITSKPFSPDYLIELITKYRITYLATNPHMLSQMVLSPNYTKEATRSIRILLVTGGLCTQFTLERARSQLEENQFLINAYGCTELGGVSANFSNFKPKSVGTLLSGIDVKVLNQQTGDPVGPHKVGVLYARSDYKWPGYYANPESQKEALELDGWFATGDLGYFDDELYLHVVDRCKEILKYNIFHYSPSEIEQTITELPDVQDVCVFGVWDESVGDAAAAAVVKKPGSNLSAEQIVAKRQEVEHKRLHAGVFFVPQIARNYNGKLMRKEMYELCVGDAEK